MGISILICCSDTKTVIKNYSDMLFSLGCLPLIKYPTRIAHSSATLIDHFYSNSITQKTTSHILTEDISDHLPIVLLLSNTNHKTIEQNIIVRDTKNFNTENFLIELSENLNIFYNNCTVDEQFERFLDIFNITLSKHAPLRKSRKEKKLNSKPCITKGILISSKTKNKLYIASLKGSANDVQLYKTYCNKLTHVKEQAKRKYYQGLVLASKHNMKFLWKTINDIAKYKKKTISLITELTCDTGEKITSSKEMANMLNNYFSEIGQKLAANIKLTNSANICSSTSFITQRCTSFYLQPITESDILKHIRQLNPSKSTGPDGIPIKYIAMSALIIAPVLTRLYNSCISTGTYPRILKIGQIVPIHKGDAKDQCCNYRPISLLSSFSKIFEKCLYERIYSYLNKNKILTPVQFGFKQNSSTSDAVRQLFDNFAENIDQKNILVLCFLTLKKHLIL